MKVLKAEFQDKAGIYTMTWSYNSNLWGVRDLIQHECHKSNSKLINKLFKFFFAPVGIISPFQSFRNELPS